MIHYRTINKELVEELQTMRVKEKLYCNEIVHLKAELMQMRERDIFLRKQYYNLAVNNFIQFIQTVHPEADILPFLKEHVHPEERISHSSVESNVPRSSAVHRRSSLIMELRRSNSLVSARKSVRSTSPIRRNGNDGEQEEQLESEEQQAHNNDQEEPTQDDSEIVLTQKGILQNPQYAHIIFEESEVEEVDNDEEVRDSNAESVYDSADEITGSDVTHTSRTLMDVTNTLRSFKNNKQTNSSNSEIIRKRRRPRKAETIYLNDQENSTAETTPSMEFDTGTNARHRYHTRLTDNTVKSMDKDTLEEPRTHSNARHATVLSESIPIPQDCDETCNNVTTPSSIYTDMTLRNFKDAPSSTPNSRRNSLRKSTMLTAISSTLKSETVLTVSSSHPRPSRQCKPKDLAEPKLSTKLRNENATKTKPKPKSHKNKL